jgi:tetratricopeptide (TPR) repeat protein
MKNKHCYNGWIKLEVGDFNGAIIDFDLAIASDKDCSYSNYGRGKAEFSKQKYEDAILYFDKTINIDKNYIWAYLYKGIAKIKLGNESGLADIELAEKLGNTFIHEEIKKLNLN